MTEVIQTESVLCCPVCGSEGTRVLYTGLRDRLFGAPGAWSYSECCQCGLIFLDPRPTYGDSSKAYAIYYTHSPDSSPDDVIHRIYRYARRGYVASKLGYTEGTTWYQRIAGYLMYLQPGRPETVSASLMHLSADRRGCLLEIGFGSGKMLAELKDLGWNVEGVDFDPRAVESARRMYGLSVHTGTVEDQSYPADRFEVVVMSHVIEHVHNPVDLLRECARVMKVGGRLIVTTPNTESRLYSRFKSNWFSLDPPRHLNLFSGHTMSRIIDEAGLKLESMRTSVHQADKVLATSMEISERGFFSWRKRLPIRRQILGSIYLCFMSLALHRSPNTGEEFVMVAVKDE